MRMFYGSFQGLQKPNKPLRHIQASLLGSLKDLVVVLPVPHDLRGQAIKPLRGLVGPGKQHVANRTRNPPIAIIKRGAL